MMSVTCFDPPSDVIGKSTCLFTRKYVHLSRKGIDVILTKALVALTAGAKYAHQLLPRLERHLVVAPSSKIQCLGDEQHPIKPK